MWKKICKYCPHARGDHKRKEINRDRDVQKLQFAEEIPDDFDDTGFCYEYDENGDMLPGQREKASPGPGQRRPAPVRPTFPPPRLSAPTTAPRPPFAGPKRAGSVGEGGTSVKAEACCADVHAQMMPCAPRLARRPAPPHVPLTRAPPVRARTHPARPHGRGRGRGRGRRTRRRRRQRRSGWRRSWWKMRASRLEAVQHWRSG